MCFFFFFFFFTLATFFIFEVRLVFSGCSDPRLPQDRSTGRHHRNHKGSPAKGDRQDPCIFDSDQVRPPDALKKSSTPKGLLQLRRADTEDLGAIDAWSVARQAFD